MTYLMTMTEACTAYIRLLKRREELTPEQTALARESYNEGWTQCQLENQKARELSK